jgi:hypothetical protein
MTHAEPKAATVRPKGIACPCGGRLRAYKTLRTPGESVTRYRLCDGCRARVITRERVLVRAGSSTAVSSEPAPVSPAVSSPFVTP